MRLYPAEDSKEVPDPYVACAPDIFPLAWQHTVQKQGFSKSSYGNVEAEEGVTCPQFAKELVVKAPRDTRTSKMLISATSHGLCFPTGLHDI